MEWHFFNMNCPHRKDSPDPFLNIMAFIASLVGTVVLLPTVGSFILLLLSAISPILLAPIFYGLPVIAVIAFVSLSTRWSQRDRALNGMGLLGFLIGYGFWILMWALAN